MLVRGSSAFLLAGLLPKLLALLSEAVISPNFPFLGIEVILSKEEKETLLSHPGFSIMLSLIYVKISLVKIYILLKHLTK